MLVVTYKVPNDADCLTLSFVPVHRGWKGIFDSFSKMIFKKSFYKNKNSQKI